MAENSNYYIRVLESAGIRRSSISSEKVLFRVQVMKRKREKLTNLERGITIFVCKYM